MLISSTVCGIHAYNHIRNSDQQHARTVDYFTRDIRQLKDLSKSLEIWDANIIADAPGNGNLLFDLVFRKKHPYGRVFVVRY